MYGTIWFFFNRVKINFPEAAKPYAAGTDSFAWRREVNNLLDVAEHPFHVLTVALDPDVDSSVCVRNETVIVTFRDIHLASDGSVALPLRIPMKYAKQADEVAMRLWVNVPASEGYTRGIHQFDKAIRPACVSFDPTEKIGLTRYQIEGRAKSFNPLAKIVGEILAGRTPEIVHSHKLPCA